MQMDIIILDVDRFNLLLASLIVYLLGFDWSESSEKVEEEENQQHRRHR